MSTILKNGTRCVIVAGCPENIGLLVVTTEHLGAHDGSEDAYRITTLSGRPFAQLNRGKRVLKNHSNVAITDRYKLRPLVDPKDKVVEEATEQELEAPPPAFDPIACAMADHPGLTRERAEAMAREHGF